MFQFKTYFLRPMDKKNNQIHVKDRTAIAVDDQIGMSQLAPYLKEKYNESFIEIHYNDLVIGGRDLVTTDPWSTYVLLVKSYVMDRDQKASEHDLVQPIMYHLEKAENGELIFSIEAMGGEPNTKTYRFPEGEFLAALFHSAIEYYKMMQIYKLEYYEYWTGRYGSFIDQIGKKLNVKANLHHY